MNDILQNAATRSAVAASWEQEKRLPLVSFIIRNRNYGRFLRECVLSLQAQTYGHFEVVLVDNASTDDSVAIAQATYAGDSRFRSLVLERNMGPLGAAIPALELCSGDFVCFVDADDVLLPSFTSHHVQAHLAAPRNLAFTTSNVLEINEAGSVLSSGRTALAGKCESDRRGLRPYERVYALPGFGHAEYETLSRAFASFPPERTGWLWGPGTSNVFRRPVVDLVIPRTDDATMVRLAADGHFARLAHVLGGSGLIDLPMSAYRIHGTNSFASMVSIGRMRNGYGPDLKDFDIRVEIAARTLLEDPERFAGAVTPSHYWNAVLSVLQIPLTDENRLSRRHRRYRRVAERLPALIATFGIRETMRGLRRILFS